VAKGHLKNCNGIEAAFSDGLCAAWRSKPTCCNFVGRILESDGCLQSSGVFLAVICRIQESDLRPAWAKEAV
jgi:hypothetical protein